MSNLRIPERHDVRVLNIGKGQPGEETNSVSAHLAGLDTVVVVADIDESLEPDIVYDIRERPPEHLRGAFDIVFVSHVLEHVEYRLVGAVISNLVEFLVPGGELYVIVPDVAWAAAQIARGNIGFGVVGALWGGQQNEYDVHKSGFTLLSLRALLENEGLATMRAFQSAYGIEYKVGDYSEKAAIKQNIVVGKVEPW